MEQRVRDTPTRPRRDAYLELLVTVGLFAIPAALNAVYAYVASELHYGTVGIGWLFASRVAQELLLIGLFFYVLRVNGEKVTPAGAFFASMYPTGRSIRPSHRRFKKVLP